MVNVNYAGNEKNGRKILALLCEITTGHQLLEGEQSQTVNDDFFKALIRFQKLCKRRNESCISLPTIRLWKHGAIPKRNSAIKFLEKYSEWMRANLIRSELWSETLNQKFESLRSIIETFEQENQAQNISAPNTEPNLYKDIDPAILIATQAFIQTSKEKYEKEIRGLFRGSQRLENEDSYYLVYRHSTNGGKILKSFLVIRSPQSLMKNTYAYNHFIRGGKNTRSIRHIFREANGMLIGLEKAFYFLGYDFSIPANKEANPSEYRKKRKLNRWQPDGLELMSVEYDDIKLHPDLHPGLIMSVAAIAQPIISRTAMLHIGTRSLLEREILDSDLNLGEIPAASLDKDIKNTIKQLKEKGVASLSDLLNETDNKTEVTTYNELAGEIMKIINNSPAWEQNLSNLNNSSTGKGALESFGSGRPRD